VISGIVVDASSGDPIHKAIVTVTWHGTPRSWATTRTDSSGTFRFNQIHLQLIPQFQVSPGAPAQTQVNSDGTFTIKSVLPVPWRRLMVDTPGIFLKSALLGATDVTDHVLDFSSGSAEPLKLILSTNMATIKGTGPAGQMVWLRRVEDTELGGIWGNQVDQTGQFSLPPVAPGKYLVVPAEPGNDMPSEVGQEVTVHEGETVTIEVKPPAQQF